MIGSTNVGCLTIELAMEKGTADATITAETVVKDAIGYGSNGKRIVGTFEGLQCNERIFDMETYPKTFSSREFSCGFRPRIVILETLEINGGSHTTRIRLDSTGFNNLDTAVIGRVAGIGVTSSSGSTMSRTIDITSITDDGYTLQLGSDDYTWSDEYTLSFRVTAIR